MTNVINDDFRKSSKVLAGRASNRNHTLCRVESNKTNFLPMYLKETSGEHMSVRILFDTTKTKYVM